MPMARVDTSTPALSDRDTARVDIGADRVPDRCVVVKNVFTRSSIFDRSLYFGNSAFSLEAMPRVVVNGKASPAGFPFAIFATPRSG
jgi:hypothetical protein